MLLVHKQSCAQHRTLIVAAEVVQEAVNEEHEGRRKNELTWKIHRIHWEKNRFIYDLMYVRKVMSRELVRCALLSVAWREEGMLRLDSGAVTARSMRTLPLIRAHREWVWWTTGRRHPTVCACGVAV